MNIDTFTDTDTDINIGINTDNMNNIENYMDYDTDDDDTQNIGMSGGKLYDEGYYGCVFVPELRCKNGAVTLPTNTDIKNGKIVDKLILKSQAEMEFMISKSIQEIPLWKNYFIVSETMCEPAPIEKQVDKNIHKCKTVQDKTLSAFRILRMKFGGVPLSLYKIQLSNFSFVDFFKHMLEGVSLLTLFGIVHRDLHQGNILVDKDGVARIIDFNLSVDARSDVTSADIRHAYTLAPFQEPPDSTLVNAIALGYNGQRIIDAIINQKTVLRNIQSLLGVSLEEMKEDLETFYSKSKSVQSGDDVKWFKTYWRTIDSWAVGVNFVILTMKLLMWAPFQVQWKQISPRVIPVLKRLCSVNPAKRYDCIQALAELDPQNYIIRRYAKKWLSKVQRST